MRAPTVKYTRQNYGPATEKLAFECGKSFSDATTSLHQQNPCLRSGIIFVTIPSCIIYYLLYQEFPIVCVSSRVIEGARTLLLFLRNKNRENKATIHSSQY